MTTIDIVTYSIIGIFLVIVLFLGIKLWVFNKDKVIKSIVYDSKIEKKLFNIVKDLNRKNPESKILLNIGLFDQGERILLPGVFITKTKIVIMLNVISKNIKSIDFKNDSNSSPVFEDFKKHKFEFENILKSVKKSVNILRKALRIEIEMIEVVLPTEKEIELLNLPEDINFKFKSISIYDLENIFDSSSVEVFSEKEISSFALKVSSLNSINKFRGINGK